MSFSVFGKKNNNQLKEPMFFGNPINVARYDQQKYPIFEKLTEKQMSFFWRPEEIDVSKDRIDFMNLPENEKHIFISNMKYQILLDSIQGRSPGSVLMPICSLPELESWINAWGFSEGVHSRSYTHIIRNIVNDPSVIFDDIMENKHILARADSVTRYYDDLYKLSHLYMMHGEGSHQYQGKTVQVTLKELKKSLYLALMAINVLEAIRFYVSFACSFAFAERSLMEGNAKIIRLIARDEALHLSGTQQMLAILASGKDDPDFADISKSLESEAIKIFRDAAEQEKEWANYLFKDGSMIGLNRDILHQYVEYITNLRMKAVNLPAIFETKHNPLPWLNSWLSSDNVQVAPQESEISSYLVGQIDSSVGTDDFDSFDL